ncbi:exodeoxyribonuclease III [Prochlorococcus marinus str. MU1404]|uniref:exodeoxyribonuclease III n=1 Tax=Prochlorococcus marinus TaxID=1219 RepID=UPI001ADC189B|nr:exodeoxyribonuclease III [Prochlorococcus marinus]MBO8229689.1 exodeoxyribonuclease III [Prochlorococcus marinus XMU1404]MBW3072767.1 exodeoxyribonuclease III [Prochlorococcus marinus str. MU1404]MCR8545976.1 exodeoxyribonuclease III [Prochlorococcus marinus CUG1432]
MLIATWNVNSIRTRLSQIINWIDKVNPDILCLQETKVTDDSFPAESFEKLGYSVEVYGQKSYNGVAIISKVKAENVKKGFYNCSSSNKNIEIFLDQKRLISADFNGVKIINVYVPNGSSLESEKFKYKINWLNCLATLIDEQEKKGELICLMGDFNVAPSDIDIHDPKKYEGGIMASIIERNALNNVLKGRLIDSFRIFEKNNGHWSWWDYRNNAYELNKGWRIDHIYISKELSSKLKSCVIDSLPRANIRPSDHVPVMIDLQLNDMNSEFYEDEDNFFEI